MLSSVRQRQQARNTKDTPHRSYTEVTPAHDGPPHPRRFGIREGERADWRQRLLHVALRISNRGAYCLQRDEIGARQCEHTMQILTDQRLLLAEASVLDSADGALLLDVATQGRLLTYYFGAQHRQVVLTDDGVEIRGRLTTRWRDSSREWLVEAAERLDAIPVENQDAHSKRRLTLALAATLAPVSTGRCVAVQAYNEPHGLRVAAG